MLSYSYPTIPLHHHSLISTLDRPSTRFSPSLQVLFFSLQFLNFVLRFTPFSLPHPRPDTPRDEQPWPSTERCGPASERERDPDSATTPNAIQAAAQLVRIFLYHPLPLHPLAHFKTRSPSLGPPSSPNLRTNPDTILFQPPYFRFFLYRHPSSSAARSRVTLVCSEVRSRSFRRVRRPVFSIFELTHERVLSSANA
jgi:hypothetical protein